MKSGLRLSFITSSLSIIAAFGAAACGSGNTFNFQVNPDGGPADDLGAPSNSPPDASDAGADGAAASTQPDASVIVEGDAGPLVPPAGCDGSRGPKDDPCVVDESLGVFVSQTLGNDATGDGTRAKPFATLAKAIQSAAKTGRRVYACAEAYGESVTLAEGISLYGYLDCHASWSVAPSLRATIQSPTSPALQGTGLTMPLRVEGFDMNAPASSLPSSSAIAVKLSAVTDLTIASSRIHALAGTDGTTAAPAAALTNAASSIDGGASIRGYQCSSTTLASCQQSPLVGAGGTNACAGLNGFVGGPGGNGGSGGVYVVGVVSGSTVQIAANPGPSLAAAATSSTAGPGAAGAPGGDGSSGTSSSGGVFSEQGFTPGSGTVGQNGTAGQGGGGGNGAALTAADTGTIPVHQPYPYYGNAGAGGGAGGCPGIAGSPGTGGGASIGLFSVNSGVRLLDATIVTEKGGAGGAGSLPSDPTAGGQAGMNVSGHAANAAGAGGRGGRGGVSGSGAGGPSIAVVYKGTIPNLSGATTTVGAAGAGRAAQSKTSAGAAVTLPASAAGMAQATFQFH